MTVTDLSHTLEPGMPYFPGTEATVFSRPFTVASHGFAEQRISMLTHSGTHMDAPAHILEAGRRWSSSACPILSAAPCSSTAALLPVRSST